MLHVAVPDILIGNCELEQLSCRGYVRHSCLRTPR